ncbi:hypothetical protein ACFW9D_24785 [Streptomyces sp. NPDC059524]|uniref:hypothetical protein n=1 Tax=Streptomyces sp. NPDC059524 TaxID=3346856 RepID=UPI003686097A
MRRPKGRDTIYFARCTTCGYILCLGDESESPMRVAELSMQLHYEELHMGRRPHWVIDTKLRREVDPNF